MASGKVIRFNEDKGFGFIKTDVSDEDVFFHVNDLSGGDPQEGQTLEFAIEEASKGPRAKRIRYAGIDHRAL